MLRPPFEVLSEADLRTRTSLKWRFYGPEVLPLWVAEMDVLLAPEVVEAVTAAVLTGDTGYPGAKYAYAEAYAAFGGQRWGWAADPAATTMCSDVMGGIRALIEALCPPGGQVVIPAPVYPPFTMAARELGRHPVHVPLTPEGRWDVAAIDGALELAGPDTVLLLCNPHNPTGALHTAAEQQAVAACAAERGATVVVDEVHAPLVPAEATFVPWLSVVDSGFVVTSAAKGFNLAALKAGLVIAGERSRPALRRLPESLPYGASHLGVVGHTAGYLADPEWLDAVNANVVDNRDLLVDLLDRHLPGVRCRPPEATYLAWLDCREIGLGDDPAVPIRRRGGVALTSGVAFGPGGAGHARLNLACSADLLRRAVEGMTAAVGGAGDPGGEAE